MDNIDTVFTELGKRDTPQQNLGVPIVFSKIEENATMPIKSSSSELGIDIFCIPDEDWLQGLEARDAAQKLCNYEFFILHPGEAHTFRTGIRMSCPPNFGFLLRDRSGLAVKHNIHVMAGVIDSTYTGEWLVHLVNLGDKPYEFRAGDKIVQAILVPNIMCSIREVSEMPKTTRGDKGFGSSGR